MIMMEEGSQRALMRNLQKEQERERRRIRDRQRRQSMSVEEREKHLARRRRNYQLRRQRAENARLDPRFNQKTAAVTSTIITNSVSPIKIEEYAPIFSVSNVNVSAQCNTGLISGHSNCIVGRNLPTRELQPQLLSMSNSLSKVDQPYSVRCGNE